jgi:hypothetical protein
VGVKLGVGGGGVKAVAAWYGRSDKQRALLLFSGRGGGTARKQRGYVACSGGVIDH